MDDLIKEASRLLERSEQLLSEAGRMGTKRFADQPVSFQPASSNRKLAPQREVKVGRRIRNVPIGPFAASTYVSIEATCPSSCPYKGSGCYAQAGMTVFALDRTAIYDKWTGVDVAQAEVKIIDGAWVKGVPQDGGAGGRDMRLHVSGDVSSTSSARLLGGAARRWTERGGGTVWTYTHRWSEIDRSVWGPIVVLASVETVAEARETLARGYAPALTVERHTSKHAMKNDGIRFVPCPAQTKAKTCVECRLCFHENLVERRMGVTFAIHGQSSETAITKLRKLNGRGQLELYGH